MSVVTVSKLNVAYPGRRGPQPAVVDLGFTIEAGESYGLAGESGSGKSTAAMALTGFLPAGTQISADVLTVAGEQVLALEPQALRRFRATKLAVVYQEPGLALNPTMPVGQQIAEVFRLRGEGRAQARERTLAAIERVRLPAPEAIFKRYPHELSGGQQQRIVIAMALAVEPELLILDEPTTGLDVRVETEIMELIDGLQAELRFASLLISHNLPLLGAHCKRVGVMQNGMLLEEGLATDVLRSPSHPYTRALIEALPDLGVTRRAALPSLGEKSTGTVDFSPSDGAGPGAPTQAPLVTLNGINKSYHRKPALRDVSLTIGRGEVLGIVGESGSGKTTLGRSIAGLTDYDGEISFDLGQSDADRESVPKVQVVFQNADLSLNPRRTVRQVLSRSIELLHGTQTAQELAASAGLSEDLLDRLPHQLSGGQKQRVAIARAFAGKAPLVVCDEPTSALDVSVQARILDLLVELQERTGVSCLFITHDLAVVRQIAHRVGVLYNGELVELKSADEIFESAEHPYTRSLVDAAVSLRKVAA